MKSGPPSLIALDPDNSHAKYVGRISDGRQFFVTTHVDTRCAEHGHAFVAVYLFNVAGKLVEALIDDVGKWAHVRGTIFGDLVERRFANLG